MHKSGDWVEFRFSERIKLKYFGVTKQTGRSLQKPYRVRIRKYGVTKPIFDQYFQDEKCAAHSRDEAAKTLLTPNSRSSIRFNCDKYPQEFAHFIEEKNCKFKSKIIFRKFNLRICFFSEFFCSKCIVCVIVLFDSCDE